MKMVLPLLFASLSSFSAVAADSFQCTRMIYEESGAFRVDWEERVDLIIDGEKIRPVVHTRAANKPISYSDCKPVLPEDSDFAQWFYRECRQLESADGRSYTVEPFLMGSYAAISPQIVPGYSVYDRIQEIAKGAGVEIPVRTFVIYAEGSPLYEYYCYSNEDIPTKSPLPAGDAPAGDAPVGDAPAGDASAEGASPDEKPNINADDSTLAIPAREGQE